MTSEELIYSLATKADLEGAVRLLDDNHRANMSGDGLKDGFISVQFTVADLTEMTENGITVVAISGDTTAGVLSAQTYQYNTRKIPLVRQMVKTLAGAHLDGEVIETTKSIVCGPVCIAKEFRGLGIMEQMYEILKNEAKTKYPVGLTLIAQSNPRSLRAHEKIGMQKISSFEFEGKTFDALAMRFA